MNKNLLWGLVIAAVIVAIWYFYGQNSNVAKKEIAPAPQEAQQPAQPLDDAPTATAKYVCDGGKIVEAKFYNGKPVEVKPGEMPVPSGKVALVFGDGVTMDLPQTISADGGRYANGDESFIFWDKGGTALVLENGQEVNYKNCKIPEAVEASINSAEQFQPVENKECQGLPVPKVEGMTYHKARPEIIKLGWQPLQTNINGDELSGQARNFFEAGYKEVESCAGTGKAYCRFLFKDGCANVLIVVTAGEEVPKLNAYAAVEELRIMEEKEKSSLGL